MSKKARPWTRQQRARIRARTEKKPFGCDHCGYWSVCWDGLCLRCLNKGIIGPNERACRKLEAKILARHPEVTGSFFGIDRGTTSTTSLSAWAFDGSSGKTLLEAISEGFELIKNMPPPPPCGTEGHPHIIPPNSIGKIVVCVICGAPVIPTSETRGIDATWEPWRMPPPEPPTLDDLPARFYAPLLCHYPGANARIELPAGDSVCECGDLGCIGAHPPIE